MNVLLPQRVSHLMVTLIGAEALTEQALHMTLIGVLCVVFAAIRTHR